MSNVKLGNQVKKIHFFDFGIGGKVIEEFADIGRARYHFLNNFAECFEDRGVIDGGKIELYFFDIYLILTDSFLQFDLILVPGIGLIEVDICLIGEDEDGAVVSVLLFKIIVDIVEVIDGLGDVRLWT